MNRTEAQGALDRLQEEKARAVDELAAAREGLDRLETESGDRLLTARLNSDEAAAKGIREELAAARGHVSELEKIEAAAERAIEAAKLDVLRAEAASIRVDVAERWPAIRDRLDAAAELLDQLRETEHTGFIPSPWIQPSGACGAGSWARTSTGEAVAALIEQERRAVALESRAGVPSPVSILAGRADIGLHLGNMGVIESPIQLKVHGSRLDDASAVLAGKPAPETPNPSRDEIARQAVTLRR